MKRQFIWLPILLCGVVFTYEFAVAQSAAPPSGDDVYSSESRVRSKTAAPESFYRQRSPEGFAQTRRKRNSYWGAGQDGEFNTASNSMMEMKNKTSLKQFERQVFTKMKLAKDEETKQELRQSIRDFLSKHYDNMLANQEEQLDAMERRLVELRDQLTRRREAKSRMLDLKYEMMISRADGLGWPDNDLGDNTFRRYESLESKGYRVEGGDFRLRTPAQK